MTTAPKLIREQLLALANEVRASIAGPYMLIDVFNNEHVRWSERLRFIADSLAAEPVGGEDHGMARKLRRAAEDILDKAPSDLTELLNEAATCIEIQFSVTNGMRQAIKDLQSESATQPDSAEGDYRVMQCPNCPTGLETADKGDINCIRCGAVMELDETAKAAGLCATDEGKGEDMRAAVSFYIANPTAALADLKRRIDGEQPKADGGGALDLLALRWERQADECEAQAKRLDGQPVAMELHRDAAQYRQCANQLRLSAAPQPEQPARDGDSEWAQIRKQYVSLMAKIDGRFRPDYMGPVERAHITSDEWDLISRYEDAAEHLSNEQARIIASLTKPPQQADGGAVAWQKRCVELGFKYWRAPDAHGVECTYEQALDLLRELLGVEVDFTPNQQEPVAVVCYDSYGDGKMVWEKHCTRDNRPPDGTKLYAARPPKSPGVSEQMVARGLDAFIESSCNDDDRISKVRKILLAALGGEK